MRKKDIVLIIVTVVLVLVLIAGFIYDRSSSLVERTTPLSISDTVKITDINKTGFMFLRNSYDARIQLDKSVSDSMIDVLADYYGVEGDFYDIATYDAKIKSKLGDEKIQPTPIEGSQIWILLAEKDGHNYVYMISMDDVDEVSLYIYYGR